MIRRQAFSREGRGPAYYEWTGVVCGADGGADPAGEEDRARDSARGGGMTLMAVILDDKELDRIQRHHPWPKRQYVKARAARPAAL